MAYTDEESILDHVCERKICLDVQYDDLNFVITLYKNTYILTFYEFLVEECCISLNLHFHSLYSKTL